jgi:hypothetical protein
MRKTALALLVTATIALAGCGQSSTSTGSPSEATESKDASKAPAKLTLSKRDQAFCTKASELPPLEDDRDGQWNVLFLMMSDYAENADLQATAEELRSKTPDGAERRPYLDRVLKTCTENGMGAATEVESESSDGRGEAASIDPATWPPKRDAQIPGIWVPDATITLPDDKWHIISAEGDKRYVNTYYDKQEKDLSAPMNIQVRNEAAGGPGGKATAADLDKMLQFALPSMKSVYENVRRHPNVTSEGGLLLAHLSYESENFWTETYKTMLYGDTLEVELLCLKDKRFPENSADACASYGEKVAAGIHPN